MIHPKRQFVLVDLDNIAFVDGVADADCLAQRVEALLRSHKGSQFGFFCNGKTYELMEGRVPNVLRQIKHAVFRAPTEKDGADHALLNALRLLYQSKQTRAARMVIVTSDKILGRLANYFRPPDCDCERLEYISFAGKSGQKNCVDEHRQTNCERFQLKFHDREDLDAFIESLELFKKRWGEK